MRQVKACVIALLLLGSMSNVATAVQAKRPDEPVRVFIDCNAFGCDFDYFRTEIPWVDHVRDRKDASVHILITSLGTGGGGSDYTLNFIGLRQFAGASDTLHYVSQNSATADDLRKGLVRVIKIGLVRYAARTHAGDNLDVTVGAVKTAAEPAKPSRDRWNYWVFKTRAGGNFNGESSQRFISLNGSLSADRVTKDWKVNTGVSGNYNESKFTLSESEDFRSYSRSYGARELIVKSMGDHWSAGQRVSLTSSTYLNQRSALRFAPAVEYDVFPYDQSTRKLITFQYSLGINAYHYRDTTIFEKINEVRPDQTLSLSLSTTQPWGSVNGSIEGANYLDDFSKRRLVLFNSLNARLFKGFSVSLFGSVSLLRDQLYLPKSDASDEEILLQRRQLATSYQYFAGVSLSYTFGSIFNNVVNPRFEGSSGQFFFF